MAPTFIVRGLRGGLRTYNITYLVVKCENDIHSTGNILNKYTATTYLDFIIALENRKP